MVFCLAVAKLIVKCIGLDQALDRDGGNAAQRCEHTYAVLLCIQMVDSKIYTMHTLPYFFNI